MNTSSSSRKTSQKSATSLRRTSRAKVYPVTASSDVCHGCSALPAGSLEVAAILLVLVFSLSAVLFTSIYATGVQTAKVHALENALASYQQPR